MPTQGGRIVKFKEAYPTVGELKIRTALRVNEHDEVLLPSKESWGLFKRAMLVNGLHIGNDWTWARDGCMGMATITFYIVRFDNQHKFKQLAEIQRLIRSLMREWVDLEAG
jgi:hypothetical protein